MRGVLLEIFKRTPFFGFISMYCSDKYFVACVKGLLLPFKCSPFAFQKDSFCSPKRTLLQCKRTPFEKLLLFGLCRKGVLAVMSC